MPPYRCTRPALSSPKPYERVTGYPWLQMPMPSGDGNGYPLPDPILPPHRLFRDVLLGFATADADQVAGSSIEVPAPLLPPISLLPSFASERTPELSQPSSPQVQSQDSEDSGSGTDDLSQIKQEIDASEVEYGHGYDTPPSVGRPESLFGFRGQVVDSPANMGDIPFFGDIMPYERFDIYRDDVVNDLLEYDGNHQYMFGSGLQGEPMSAAMYYADMQAQNVNAFYGYQGMAEMDWAWALDTWPLELQAARERMGAEEDERYGEEEAGRADWRMSYHDAMMVELWASVVPGHLNEAPETSSPYIPYQTSAYSSPRHIEDEEYDADDEREDERAECYSEEQNGSDHEPYGYRSDWPQFYSA